jgi:hypothetical protein
MLSRQRLRLKGRANPEEAADGQHPTRSPTPLPQASAVAAAAPSGCSSSRRRGTMYLSPFLRLRVFLMQVLDSILVVVLIAAISVVLAAALFLGRAIHTSGSPHISSGRPPPCEEERSLCLPVLPLSLRLGMLLTSGRNVSGSHWCSVSDNSSCNFSRGSCPSVCW